ncbi:hypothetical protein SSAG_03433 [Streptomyces sp. Mg1]|nr:hypothetical protein SSAG_03433 [Streptomyces sp. Mg1]
MQTLSTPNSSARPGPPWSRTGCRCTRTPECVHDGSAEAGGFGFPVTQHLPDDAVERREGARAAALRDREPGG